MDENKGCSIGRRYVGSVAQMFVAIRFRNRESCYVKIHQFSLIDRLNNHAMRLFFNLPGRFLFDFLPAAMINILDRFLARQTATRDHTITSMSTAVERRDDKTKRVWISHSGRPEE